MNNNTENTELEQLLDPKELATAFEHTMNFVKGDTEALPDVLQHSGRLLLKLSRRLSTTQMILLVGALTVGAIFIAKRVEDSMDEYFDDEDENTKGGRKALGSGSAGGQSNASAGKSSAAGSGSKQSSNSDSADKKTSNASAGAGK